MSPVRQGSSRGRLRDWPAHAITLAAVSLLAGCGEPEAAEPAPPAPVAFEGAIDPLYVGHWATANKGSTLDLGADGKAAMVNVAPGRGTSKAAGEWKLSGDSLLIKVDGGGQVSRYGAKLTGDRLKLTQKASRLDVEYRRAK
jgi:hypothetical protein